MKEKKTKIVGILGGIGSGKSTVAQEFEKLGCAVLNADKIAQEYLDTPEVVAKLKDLFGQGVINPDGKANRKAISDIVFADFEKLSTLNRLIHPLVMKEIESKIEKYQKDFSIKAIILDVPLLLEVGWDKKCDILIFIDCPIEKRLARVEKKCIISANQLELRESFQISLDKKSKNAHYIINNNSDLESLHKQVIKVFSDLVV